MAVELVSDRSNVVLFPAVRRELPGVGLWHSQTRTVIELRLISEPTVRQPVRMVCEDARY
jgi:hypothetical protein